MLLTPLKVQNDASLPSSLCIGTSDIQLSTVVRNLGVTLDSSLSFKQHVSNVCKAAYLEIRKISSIRHFLSTEATKTLVCAMVLSRLDYCNSLLAGLPKCLLDKLQKVQNSAARLVCRSSRRDHITPLLRSLHWLPIQSRIDYKLASICFSYVSGSAPQYLSEVLHVYTPSRQLRSSADSRLLRIPTVRTKGFGQRSFSFQGPTIWNKQPFSTRHSPSATSFRTSTKTNLFKQL